MIVYFLLFGIIRGIKNTFYVIIKVWIVGFQKYLIVHGVSIIITLFSMYAISKIERGKKLNKNIVLQDFIVFVGDFLLLLSLLFTSHDTYLVFMSEIFEDIRIKTMSNAESLFFSIYGNEDRSKLTGIKTMVFSIG